MHSKGFMVVRFTEVFRDGLTAFHMGDRHDSLPTMRQETPRSDRVVSRMWRACHKTHQRTRGPWVPLSSGQSNGNTQ